MSTQYHHPELHVIRDTEGWRSAEQVSEMYADVFNHQSLLTDKLKLLATDGVRVECVSQEYNQEKTAQRRDVVIFVDDHPQVLASTIIPEQMLTHYPALATLGNQPIGEFLESNYGATRSETTVRLVDSANELNKNFPHSGDCFLRRYDYLLEHGKITIVELFSPPIVVLLRAQLLEQSL